MIQVIDVFASAYCFTPLTTTLFKTSDKVNSDLCVRLLHTSTILTRPLDGAIQIVSVPIFAGIQEWQLCSLYFHQGKIAKGAVRLMVSPFFWTLKTLAIVAFTAACVAIAILLEPLGAAYSWYNPEDRAQLFFSRRESIYQASQTNNPYDIGRRIIENGEQIAWWVPLHAYLCFRNKKYDC